MIRLFVFACCILFTAERTPDDESRKINGVNLVGPAKPVGPEWCTTLKNINAGWVALNPFAYCQAQDTAVHYDMDWQWWGERTDGVKGMIIDARKAGLKIMIKPHIWVMKQGWPGEFMLEDNQALRRWEQSYEQFILEYAHIAAEHNVELFSIGTELRKMVVKRPGFFNHLIRKVRQVYKGQLTYCSNWDNYEKVSFWGKLDYMSVHAYFPLSESETPTIKELNEAWELPKKELARLSKSTGKRVLFTEYGYRSTNRTAWRQWELGEHWEAPGKVNLQAQYNAYEAFYQSLWDESWVAGGFIWKWYSNSKAGGVNNSDYTPQNKPVEEVIQKWYGTN